MSEASPTAVSPELVELLRAMTTLFPDHYPNTKGWLSEQSGQRIGSSLSSVSDVASEATTSSRQVGQDEAKKLRDAYKRERRGSRQALRGSASQHERQAQQPGRAPVVPALVWPTMPSEVRQLPSSEIPDAWARAHGYGMLLQRREQQELMSAFAGKLAFPPDRAGPMGVLIMFEDSWQASAGRTTVSVYHPREPSPKLALVDVARDDKIVAQFEVPLQLLDARFVMALLPVEWRRGS